MEQVPPDNNAEAKENDYAEAGVHEGPHTKPSLNNTIPFWSTIIPVLVSRQLFQSANTIFKPFKKQLEEGRITHKFPRFLASNFYSLFFGGLVAAVSGFYGKRDLDAIKTLYSGPVAAELGKKKEDVTLADILFRSKNMVIRNSVKEFRGTGIARSLVISTFFLPWHFLSKEIQKPHNIQASVGAGAMGLYVLKNRFNPNISVLEALQNIVDTKLHHNDDKPYDIITADDIGHLLVIQRRNIDKTYKQSDLATLQEQEEISLSQRIADLLNETYHNSYPDAANLTLGKFIYLMGMEAKGTGKSFLNQSFPINMAYVELANQYHAKEIEEVADAIASGTAWRDVFGKYGIAIGNYRDTADPTSEKQDVGKRYVVTPAGNKLTDGVKKTESYTQRVLSSQNGGARTLE